MIHVLHTFANNSSVPFLTWFARKAAQEGRLRFSFLVMHNERPALLDEMTALGHACHWIPFDQEHRKRGMIGALPRLWWHMRRLRPDVMHGHMFDDALPGLIAARAAGIKARVITRHDTGYHWKYTPRWVFVDRFNARLATDVIAISSEGREHLIGNERLDPSRISLVPNGVPLDFADQVSDTTVQRLRARFDLRPEHTVIGTVARFIEWKGYRHVVDAARSLVAERPELRFVFCGTGQQETEIRTLVHAAGLDAHVVFTGRVEPADMASLYRIFDLLLQAPDHEPFGFVYAEAMLCGTPVVSTRTGAARDGITHGIDGILVEQRSGAALAAGVQQALCMDRRALSEAARTKARAVFGFDGMWNGYLRVYEQALQRNA